MELATTVEGKQIAASGEAPEAAWCPQCGHPVTLRKRRLMNDRGFVYFWRHKPGGDLSCSARSSNIVRNERRY